MPRTARWLALGVLGSVAASPDAAATTSSYARPVEEGLEPTLPAELYLDTTGLSTL